MASVDLSYLGIYAAVIEDIQRRHEIGKTVQNQHLVTVNLVRK